MNVMTPTGETVRILTDETRVYRTQGDDASPTEGKQPDKNVRPDRRPRTPLTKPTFAQLVKAEPRLADLARAAARVVDDRRAASFCANAHWYGYRGLPGLKPALEQLVGWGAQRRDEHPVLGTSAAYDVAYETIYCLLPDCRNCGEWGV